MKHDVSCFSNRSKFETAVTRPNEPGVTNLWRVAIRTSYAMRVSRVIVAILAMSLAAALSLSCVETIPPRAMTQTRLTIIEYRVRNYYLKHGQLPSTLTDLPPLDENRDSSFLDGWANPIRYSTDGVMISLLSLGRDGRIGGTGQDADLERMLSINALSQGDAGKKW